MKPKMCGFLNPEPVSSFKDSVHSNSISLIVHGLIFFFFTQKIHWMKQIIFKELVVMGPPRQNIPSLVEKSKDDFGISFTKEKEQVGSFHAFCKLLYWWRKIYTS